MAEENKYLEVNYDGNAVQRAVQKAEDIVNAEKIAQEVEEVQQRSYEIFEDECIDLTGITSTRFEELMKKSDESDVLHQYLVDGALLTCTQATLEDFILPDAGMFSMSEVISLDQADEDDDAANEPIDLGMRCRRMQASLNVSENPIGINGKPYATVKDTIKGKNIMPFRCNCRMPADRDEEKETIAEHLELCRESGVCQYLMRLNEEWDNMSLGEGKSYLMRRDIKAGERRSAGAGWLLGGEDTEGEEVEGITRTSVLFCKHGGLIVPLTSGQELIYNDAETVFMWNLVLKTQTGANLITDDSNPAHIPLYDGLTMSEPYMKVDLTPYPEAKYSEVKITVDYTQIEGNLYRNIHPYRDLDLPKSFNEDYHGSFSSGGNTFSMADNRIEIAVMYGISTVDGEEYGLSLAGKYIDIELSDGTVLACIMGASKGNEPGSQSNGIVHHDGSIIEFLSCESYASKADKNVNGPNKEDILHGQDIVSAYVYSEKRLYDDNTKEYTYYFSDGVTE